MSAESTRAYLARYGLDEKIITYDVLTATVEQAAEASGLEPEQIGKTMAFDVDDDAVLVVCAGDAKVWNSAFKRQFHTKPTFIKPEELEERVGHPMGGVCPFDTWTYRSGATTLCDLPPAARTQASTPRWKSLSRRVTPWDGWTCARAGARSRP